MENQTDIMIESDVLALLGIGGGALKRLRDDYGFPFTQAGIKRVYLESEIIKWILANQRPVQGQ